MVVTGVILNRLLIIGYRLKDRDKEINVTVNDLIKLIKERKVGNLQVVNYEDKDYIVGLDVTKLEIVGNYVEMLDREIVDGKVVGFKVIGEAGKEYTISTKKAWELAALNKITNLEASFTLNNNLIVKYLKQN